MNCIAVAKEEGAIALTGADRALESEGGYFIKPTVFINTRASMQIVKEEVFGPVIVAMPFDDVDDVIRQANDTPFGLAASVWSQNHSLIHRTIPRLRAGMIWVNTHNMLDNNLPLGGHKHSGYGHDLGRTAVESYTELKSVCMSI
jgi:phenylacetaldehyde dehydrogenase